MVWRRWEFTDVAVFPLAWFRALLGRFYRACSTGSVRFDRSGPAALFFSPSHAAADRDSGAILVMALVR